MKASWTIRRIPEKGIVTVTISGGVTPADTERLTADIAAMKLDPEKVRILVDQRAANIEYSSMDLFLHSQYYKAQPSSPSFWVAMVYGEISENEKYYKEICRQQGSLRLEIFADYDEALRWLTSPERR